MLAAASVDHVPVAPDHARRTPRRVERRIIKLRYLRRWGPARIPPLHGGHRGLESFRRPPQRPTVAAPQVRKRAAERLIMSADHVSQKLLEWRL